MSESSFVLDWDTTLPNPEKELYVDLDAMPLTVKPPATRGTVIQILLYVLSSFLNETEATEVQVRETYQLGKWNPNRRELPITTKGH